MCSREILIILLFPSSTSASYPLGLMDRCPAFGTSFSLLQCLVLCLGCHVFLFLGLFPNFTEAQIPAFLWQRVHNSLFESLHVWKCIYATLTFDRQFNWNRVHLSFDWNSGYWVSLKHFPVVLWFFTLWILFFQGTGLNTPFAILLWSYGCSSYIIR